MKVPKKGTSDRTRPVRASVGHSDECVGRLQR